MIRLSTIDAGFDAAFADVDLLVMPTCVTVAPRYVDPPTDRVAAAELWLNMEKRATASAVLNTQPYNYTGHPAIAVPCGKAGRLPISMQLVGRRLDDALVLRAAYAYQQRVDWDELPLDAAILMTGVDAQGRATGMAGHGLHCHNASGPGVAEGTAHKVDAGPLRIGIAGVRTADFGTDTDNASDGLFEFRVKFIPDPDEPTDSDGDGLVDRAEVARQAARALAGRA